jgi:hypothetical protein
MKTKSFRSFVAKKFKFRSPKTIAHTATVNHHSFLKDRVFVVLLLALIRTSTAPQRLSDPSLHKRLSRPSTACMHLCLFLSQELEEALHLLTCSNKPFIASSSFPVIKFSAQGHRSRCRPHLPPLSVIDPRSCLSADPGFGRRLCHSFHCLFTRLLHFLVFCSGSRPEHHEVNNQTVPHDEGVTLEN